MSDPTTRQVSGDHYRTERGWSMAFGSYLLADGAREDIAFVGCDIKFRWAASIRAYDDDGKRFSEGGPNIVAPWPEPGQVWERDGCRRVVESTDNQSVCGARIRWTGRAPGNASPMSRWAEWVAGARLVEVAE